MSEARALGPGLAMMLVAGNMIGSGVYLLPASLAAFGSISLIGWLAGIAVALIYAAVFASLATARPQDEGFLGSIGAAFGAPVGFMAGALYWFQTLLGNVGIAFAATGYLAVFVPALGEPANATLGTAAVIWATVAVNLVGARFVARFEGWALALGLLPVLLVGIGGWLVFDRHLFAASWNVTGRPMLAVVPQAMLPILWAFLGLESASLVARLVIDPARNVARATIGGVLIAAVAYLLACTALTGILSARALAASSAPFADATAVMLGAGAGLAIAACAALKASGTLAGWVLVLAESGDATLRTGRAASPGHGPGRTSLIVSGALMTGVLLATRAPSLAERFTTLVDAVVVIMLLIYAATGLALARLGSLRPERVWPVRLLGIAAAAVSLAIVAAQPRSLVLWTGAVCVAAVALWFAWGRGLRDSKVFTDSHGLRPSA